MQNTPAIGKVLRANTRSFVFGTKVPKTDVPIFGSLVKTAIQYQNATVYGLIYNIEVLDDGMTKMLSVAEDVRPEEIAYQRSRRVPVEASVLAVGCQPAGGAIRYALPAQPPITLDPVHICSDEEVEAFTARPDFLPLIMDYRDAPVDELLAAVIRLAGELRAPAAADTYLMACGRELARLLGGDSLRLERLLRRLK
jgi:hypothetical protein